MDEKSCKKGLQKFLYIFNGFVPAFKALKSRFEVKSFHHGSNLETFLKLLVQEEK
jgi:hypothetical protein